MTTKTTRISNATLAATFTALTGHAAECVTSKRFVKASSGETHTANVYPNEAADCAAITVAVAHGDGFNAGDARLGCLRDLLERYADWFVCRAVQQHADLNRQSITWLRGEYKRSHRVSDVRGMTKGDFVLALLADSSPRRAASAALALPRIAYTWLNDQVVVPGK